MSFLRLVPRVTRWIGLLTVPSMTRTLAPLLFLVALSTGISIPEVPTSVMLLLVIRFLLIVVPAVVKVLLTCSPPLPTLILAVVLVPTIVMLLVSPVRCLRSPLWLKLEAAALTRE